MAAPIVVPELVSEPPAVEPTAPVVEAPTPVVCHIGTRDLAFHTRRADLLFVAVGKAGLIGPGMVKPGATVLWPTSTAPARRIYSHTSTALFRGDHLFSAKSSGELICVEASTGQQVWESAKVTDLKNGASIHLTPNGDSVLLYTDKGELIRAQLTSQGYKEISRVAVLEPTFPFAGRNVAWSPPAYANRHIFARNGKELICASLAAKP